MAALVYTEPDGRLATWRDRKRYLWLLALIPSSATFIAVGLVTATGWNVFWWTGPLIAFALIPVIGQLPASAPSGSTAGAAPAAASTAR